MITWALANIGLELAPVGAVAMVVIELLIAEVSHGCHERQPDTHSTPKQP